MHLPKELKEKILIMLEFETLVSLGDTFLYIQKRKYSFQDLDDVVWDGKFNTLKWILKHTSQTITKNGLSSNPFTYVIKRDKTAGIIQKNVVKKVI